MWISMSWEVTILWIIYTLRSSNVAMGKPMAKKHVFFMGKSSKSWPHSHFWSRTAPQVAPSHPGNIWEPSQVPSCSTIIFFRTEIIPQSEIGWYPNVDDEQSEAIHLCLGIWWNMLKPLKWSKAQQSSTIRISWHSKIRTDIFHQNPCPIWGWVKTLVPSEPQNSWDLWMFIPLKMYLWYWSIPI